MGMQSLSMGTQRLLLGMQRLLMGTQSLSLTPAYSYHFSYMLASHSTRHSMFDQCCLFQAMQAGGDVAAS